MCPLALPYIAAAAALCAECSNWSPCCRLAAAESSAPPRTRFLLFDLSFPALPAFPPPAAFASFSADFPDFFALSFFALFLPPDSSAPASAAASASSPLASASSTLRFSVLFQWFLIALSVRPTNVFAISAHLFPNVLCAMIKLRSSSRDHSSRLISGLRWLYHRSRHCLPIRPGSCCAILLHCFAPNSPTSSMILASSSLVQGPFTSSGFSTFCHR
mmetsp:Transcript_6391/g.21443  ORF Transcript_6391/g.21443 Transcript_6391/m.21443 type:complete len:217 (+) Transcript_6391:1338-1988(+)